MNMVIRHVINPATSNNKFKTLVEYVEYKLLNRIIRSLKPNGRNVKKDYYVC
jgi:hypothetical protein